MMYHYTMCGLDYVYLCSGFHMQDTDYGEGVSIERADELDRAIAFSVITSHARICGQEVRFLRSLLRYSQTEIAIEIGVKRVTVARWEGAPHTPIPGPPDRLLRVVAAKELFGAECAEMVMNMFLEITDDRADTLIMAYRPDERAEEPTLFPEDSEHKDGWRPTKVTKVA